MKKDIWERLRLFTPARIALGRAGASLPTREVLRFRLDHARARDAVNAPFSAEEFIGELSARGIAAREVQTQVDDRASYLRRPDLGRQLNAQSARELEKAEDWQARDVAILVSPGLSSLAVKANGVRFISLLLSSLGISRLTFTPVLVAPWGRVALQDDVGERLKARICLMLIGERPGLGSVDSLGLYLVFGPKRGKTDADRNCISNVRDGGLSCEVAVEKAIYLVTESLRRQISGVGLKEESGRLVGGKT